jgi:NAD(P)-dependent dehydrogenase (short-subunit alcohol dehydrogenase family)
MFLRTEHLACIVVCVPGGVWVIRTAAPTTAEGKTMSTSTVLQGRTALVTGATSGIGKAVARSLARQGAEVVLNGRDRARGEALVKEIAAEGGSARFIAADLTDAADTLRLAAEAGAVDILVSNAGLYEFAPTAATDAASFDRHVAVNTRAPFLLVGALAPGMAERGHGSIVIVGSSAARQPAPVGAAYGASKAGVEILTRYWATEFGPAGVRINTVSPGPVHTEGTQAMLGEHIGVLDTTNARGRAGDPAEIAEIVSFLAGAASSYVNGAVLFADGGERSTLPA